jgi:hypothetical protein
MGRDTGDGRKESGLITVYARSFIQIFTLFPEGKKFSRGDAENAEGAKEITDAGRGPEDRIGGMNRGGFPRNDRGKTRFIRRIFNRSAASIRTR